MAKNTQKQSGRIALENLVGSLPERIESARKKVGTEAELKKKVNEVWTERGEKYDALSCELGSEVFTFLNDYVTKLWPTIEGFLESSKKETLDVDALKRKYMREQPILSFSQSYRNSPTISYCSGFRSGRGFEPIDISLAVLEKDPKNVPILLIGNKLDLRKNPDIETIPTQEGLNCAKELSHWSNLDVLYYETSALIGLNIESAFKALIDLLITSAEN